MTADINFNLLRTFLLIAETRSFRGASEQAHRSQSAISAQIKLLEAQVGAELFHRTTRRVVVSEAGERVYHWAQRILDDVDHLVEEVGVT
uniref:LysR family transcriptional regulator n=1 Tax=Escherichia coli TaxID=562 RepID=UPI00227EF7FD